LRSICTNPTRSAESLCPPILQKPLLADFVANIVPRCARPTPSERLTSWSRLSRFGGSRHSKSWHFWRREERIFVELVTSDRKLNASRQGSK
jgi:hypothetical protein